MKYYVKLGALCAGYSRTVEADSPEAAEAMVREEFSRDYGESNLICLALEDAPPGRMVHKRRNPAKEAEGRAHKMYKHIVKGEFDEASKIATTPIR